MKNEKLLLLVIYRQKLCQQMPRQKKHTIMTILLFLERQESYHHIRIVTGNAFMQGLHGFFRRLSHGWVDTVTCLNTAVRTKAQEPVSIAVVKQFYVSLSHYFVRFYPLLAIQDWLMVLLVFLVSCKFGPGRHPLFCHTAQKMKFSIKDFFSKWVGHIYRRKL